MDPHDPAPPDSFGFVVQAVSRATPERLFAIVADGAGWARWAGPLVPRSRWEREGTPAPGGVGAIRRLGLGPLASREEITEYAPPHRLGYRLLGGPVRGYRATVELSPLPAGGTQIQWRGGFDAAPFGTRGVARLVLHRIVRGLARRLAQADR